MLPLKPRVMISEILLSNLENPWGTITTFWWQNVRLSITALMDFVNPSPVTRSKPWLASIAIITSSRSTRRYINPHCSFQKQSSNIFRFYFLYQLAFSFQYALCFSTSYLGIVNIFLEYLRCISLVYELLSSQAFTFPASALVTWGTDLHSTSVRFGLEPSQLMDPANLWHRTTGRGTRIWTESSTTAEPQASQWKRSG